MKDSFPQPSRRDGKEPCGECHLQPGETCDICGARQAPLVPSADHARLLAEVEGLRAGLRMILAMYGDDLTHAKFREAARYYANAALGARSDG